MPSPPRRRLFALAAVLSGLLAALLGAEAVARLAGRGPTTRGPSLEAALWVRDPALGWRNRSDARLVYHLTGSTITTGPHGERGPAPGPGHPVALFVGDSTTFCGELDDERTAPAEVARRVPGLTAINAGVRGHGTIQALRLAEEWLARRPIDLVVYTYCDNDRVENVNPRGHPPALAPTGRVVDGRLVIDDVPPGWGPAGAPVGLEPPPPPFGSRAWWSQAARGGSALVTLLIERAGAQDALPRLRELAKLADARGGDAVLRAALARLRDACAARGARLLVTEFTTGNPAENTMTRAGLVEALCRELGIPFADVHPAFHETPFTVYQAPTLSGAVDSHWGPKGTATFAEALAPRVAALLGR